ncbi:tyrosine--tRNA ligase [Patescibacteria group bacterium]
MEKESIEQFLTRGVENVYPSKKFVEAKLKKEKNLKMYLGIDPTGPTLHLGHAIVLRKLRQWQEMGHQVILLIGDFTGMIGDPTDKSAARKRLTRDEVLKNAEKYKTQASRFLSFSGKNKAELKYNSKWLAKMSFAEVVDLASHFTVQQMSVRDMFERRIKEGEPVFMHEFLYPLMQGYDSVVMDIDGEIGGNDQTFNMLAGRTLMKSISGKEKFVLTMKLLTDPSGAKMGKSEGNMITFEDSPEEMFGKVMSWTDGMILPGFELLTDLEQKEIDRIAKDMKAGANPRDAKAQLAKEIVAGFYDVDKAKDAQDKFEAMFKDHQAPEDVPEFVIKGQVMNIIDVLVESELVSSKTEARRLIDGGGIKLDSQTVENYDTEVIPNSEGILVQKGKRHFIRAIKK